MYFLFLLFIYMAPSISSHGSDFSKRFTCSCMGEVTTPHSAELKEIFTDLRMFYCLGWFILVELRLSIFLSKMTRAVRRAEFSDLEAVLKSRNAKITIFGT